MKGGAVSAAAIPGERQTTARLETSSPAVHNVSGLIPEGWPHAVR
jgi:hypothetical protein